MGRLEPDPAHVRAAAPRRRRLLTQNSDLRKQGIYNWSIPAFAGVLPDGRRYNTCPSAGACAPLCYARQGHYRFGNVKARHEANLMMVLDDLPGWEAQMTAELQHKRYQDRWVRCHDAGDFFAITPEKPLEYTQAWMRIMRAAPGVRFYAYTKSISLFREAVEPDPPANFKWVYSLGGREDHLIDTTTERHVDIFPDEKSLAEAGYTSRAKEGCLVSVLGPQRIGIAANRIPHLRRKQGDKRFSELQAAQDECRRSRNNRKRHPRCAPPTPRKARPSRCPSTVKQTETTSPRPPSLPAPPADPAP
ncbi:hypothetical protein [Streptomyces sp. NPDC058595]|uniref:GP88 family protein n=1 Tax=Streptomyces sp. NPDC058595 TaxID=3346550 RepID=UPI003669381E